jgi:hypothetical protein
LGDFFSQTHLVTLISSHEANATVGRLAASPFCSVLKFSIAKFGGKKAVQDSPGPVPANIVERFFIYSRACS